MGKSRKTIAVVGSGIVGTATGLGFATKGHDVFFCDVDPARVHLLRVRGLEAIGSADLHRVHADAYLVSVPTPTTGGRVNLSFVQHATEAIGRAISERDDSPLVVVRSTVPPGTTEQVVIPALERATKRIAGRGFGVGMNPEFLRAVSAEEDFLYPRVIVIGALDVASEAGLRRLYAPWRGVPLIATDLRTAEATKYVSNLFNAAKISFYNEMHRMLTAIGADPAVAFDAAARGAEGMWNARYGTRGGAPYKGVCLPKDTVGFLSFAAGLGMDDLLPMVRATIRVNEEMEAAERSRSRTPEASQDEPTARAALHPVSEPPP